MRVTAMQGANAIFIGGIPTTFKIGGSSSIAANFILKIPRSKFSFESSLAYSENSYKSKADDFMWMTYAQNNWGLFFQSRIDLNEYVIFKSGIFIQKGVTDNNFGIRVSEQKGYKSISASNEGIRENYYPTKMQAGVVMGFTFYGSEKQRLGLDLQLQQYGGRVVDSDYFMPTMKSKKMISTSSRPIILMAGLNYKLQKRRKRLPDEERLISIEW